MTDAQTAALAEVDKRIAALADELHVAKSYADRYPPGPERDSLVETADLAAARLAAARGEREKLTSETSGG
jgi:hypothetical protein